MGCWICNLGEEKKKRAKCVLSLIELFPTDASGESLPCVVVVDTLDDEGLTHFPLKVSDVRFIPTY